LVEAAAARARNAAPLERDAEQQQKDEEFYKYSRTIYNAAQQQQLQAQQELVHTQTPPPPLVHTQQQPVHTQQQLVPARTLQPTRNEQDDILHCHMNKDNWSENIFFKRKFKRQRLLKKSFDCRLSIVSVLGALTFEKRVPGLRLPMSQCQLALFYSTWRRREAGLRRGSFMRISSCLCDSAASR